MTTYATNEFRGGLKVLLDGQPHHMIENEFVKPGKGQAFNRVKYRNLLNGRVIERTYKSGETVEGADVVEVEVQYLYNDGEFWHFMQPESFDQYQASETAVGDTVKWLKEQDICTMIIFNGEPISVEAPNFVNLEVTFAEPGLKGDSSGGVTKPVTMETGVSVRVPLFINQGEVLKIDTRNGEYVSRVKS